MELRRCTYANCASHVLTVDYAPNQEATSVLHGLVSDSLTKLSPSQRHLPGIHCQLTFVIVVARQHSRNISRLSSFTQLLICISILLFYFYSTLSVVYVCCIVRRCWTLAEWRLSKCSLGDDDDDDNQRALDQPPPAVWPPAHSGLCLRVRETTTMWPWTVCVLNASVYTQQWK